MKIRTGMRRFRVSTLKRATSDSDGVSKPLRLIQRCLTVDIRRLYDSVDGN